MQRVPSADTFSMKELIHFLGYVAILVLPIALAVRITRSAAFEKDE